jgi:hypothetical protein
MNLRMDGGSKNNGLKFEWKFGEEEAGRETGRDIYRVDL